MAFASRSPSACTLFPSALAHIRRRHPNSFTLQQWSGQNSVGYYAPQIFKLIGYSSNSAALLTSGVYGIIKVVATALFVLFVIDRTGRKWTLFFSGMTRYTSASHYY